MGENGKVTIAKIEAESFLMISKLDYEPRQCNVFAGRNAQGKTNIILLLKAALKGAGAEVIQKGKDKTSLLVRLSDGHEIKRAITEKSKRFQVRTPDGDIKASPQAYIDALLGDSDLSFDPVSFVLKDPKSQKTMLLETFNIGTIKPEFLQDVVDEETMKLLDFSKEGLSVLKDAETLYYSRRTEINKEASQKKGHYEDLMAGLNGWTPGEYDPKKARKLSEDLAVLEQELSDAKAIKKQAEGTNKTVETLKEKIMAAEQELLDIDDEQITGIADLERKVVTLEDTIKKLHMELADTKAAIDTARKAKAKKADLQQLIKGHSDTIETLPKLSDIPDIDPILNARETLKLALEGEDKQKANYETYMQAQEINAEYQTKDQEAKALTEKIEILRKDLPTKLTADIELPFESMSFDGDDVLINGSRLSLMSTMEQLMFSLELFLARNKDAKLRMVCVDRIEVLDTEHYEYFWKWCHTNNIQAFCTRVLSAAKMEEEVMVENGEIVQ